MCLTFRVEVAVDLTRVVGANVNRRRVHPLQRLEEGPETRVGGLEPEQRHRFLGHPQRRVVLLALGDVARNAPRALFLLGDRKRHRALPLRLVVKVHVGFPLGVERQIGGVEVAKEEANVHLVGGPPVFAGEVTGLKRRGQQHEGVLALFRVGDDLAVLLGDARLEPSRRLLY